MDFCRLELGKVDLQSIDFDIEYLINDVYKRAVEHKKDLPVDIYINITDPVHHFTETAVPIGRPIARFPLHDFVYLNDDCRLDTGHFVYRGGRNVQRHQAQQNK